MPEKQKISLNIDSELWHRFRLKTLQERKTATDVIEELLLKYLKEKH